MPNKEWNIHQHTIYKEVQVDYLNPQISYLDQEISTLNDRWFFFTNIHSENNYNKYLINIKNYK